jgi:hypothetical protein
VLVTSTRTGYANRPNQVIDGTGTFTPPDSQPCRLLTLLNALVGSEVRSPARSTPKAACSAEDERIALPGNRGTTTRHRLTLMIDGGLVQIGEVTTLGSPDPQGRRSKRALAGLAENRAQSAAGCRLGFSAKGPATPP